MSFDEIRELIRVGDEDRAVEEALRLANESFDDATVQYGVACVFDSLGRESSAVPFYVRALAGRLSHEDRRGAILGLGSTYRTLGKYGESDAILSKGLAEFPDASEMVVFHAMTKYNLKQSKAAVSDLLRLLCSTSSDAHVQLYRRAIDLYAEDLDKTWEGE